MSKYKTIAIPAQDNLSCEVFQRVAFSHNYKWAKVMGNLDVQNVDPLDWLTFDPNIKVINVTTKPKSAADLLLVATTAELLQALANPTPVNKTLVNTAKTFKAEVTATGIQFITAAGRQLTVDREIVKLVADELGLAGRHVHAIAKFEYPDSSRGGLPKVRFVRLTNMDDTYLKGYEVGHPASNEVGEFKNFVRNRILDAGRIELVKFSL